MIIGIDPGLRGAAVAITDSGSLIDYLDTPTYGGKYCLEDLYGGLEWLITRELMFGPPTAYIERQGTRPRQSCQSAFTTGYGYGLWIMALAALEVSTVQMQPATWCKVMRPGGLRKGKASSITNAQRLFPSLELAGPKGGAKDGRADAALIAEYGRRLQ
ncbi:MAG: hypothetical protein V3W44_09725 [Dehalococcoidales bacterium]